MTVASAWPGDSSFIERIRAGDEHAYQELFHRHYRELCRYAARLSPTPGAAEEIVQDVFLKVWLRRYRLKEVRTLRSEVDEKLIIITPGVRPAWSAADDQKRFTTPREAIENGADYLVIGRPITAAEPSKRNERDDLAGGKPAHRRLDAVCFARGRRAKGEQSCEIAERA